ncbi:MAG: translocation/assembly module TamB domain-containing protein, partial [Alphaproteobacteria bacterium]|nr:translocation/assembly module TamB domain-containing protein [Alphaproteobacteria bacterium]
TDISLSAEKKIEKVMVGARFQQINNSSRISFYSTPYLSDKDIMSYMLFDKPTSEISAGEGLALFSAMTKLSGHSSFDILDKMKTAFGIDSISIKKNIDSNQEEYNAISIGKKIGKFKVSVDQGTASDTTGVVVEADIAKNVKMSVDLNGRDSATAGILWSRRY